MSAFFIPQLGSQMYAMAGMRSRLHLIASETGIYDGMNTQFNGDGFSDMYFSVHVLAEKDMRLWIKKIKTFSLPLSKAAYNHLTDPSIADKPAFFSGIPHHLFENVINMNMNTFGTVHPHSDDQGNFKYAPKAL
jgi:cytochrome o ubiquinol oxidase subunit 2